MKHRPMYEIERDLAAARAAYARSGPTHHAVAECERLYNELQAANAPVEGPAPPTDPLELAHYYREKWLDEIDNDTGNRRPRMGDVDPLGEAES